MSEHDVATLADLLHETSEHHGVFESTAPPHNWWDWYAAYMDAREHGASPDEASRQAGVRMEKILSKGTPAPPSSDSSGG